MSYPGLGGGAGKLSAVDAILAEAADLVALEQIAKLNTAHLADDDDSALPSALESRFRKLKSLPAAAPAAAHVKTLGRSVTAPHATSPSLDPPHATPLSPDPPPPPCPTPQPQQPTPAVQVQEPQRPGEGEDAAGKKENSPPPPPTRQVHEDDEDLERLFRPAGGRGRPMLRERNRGISRDDDDDGGGSSASPPPHQACCFGFSPKTKPLQRAPTKSKKSSKEGGVLGVDADDWGDENRRMVAGLKEQQRQLKKALEEQVKVSRETAKMARWVKQASARMTHTDAIDDLLSDLDEDDDDFK